MPGLKPSHAFFVTLPRNDWGRLFVYNIVEPDCCELVVSEEAHSNLEPHLHLYLRTLEAFHLPELRCHLVHQFREALDLREDPALDIVACRSPRNVLVYITKEDVNCLIKNVDTRLLSFNYRCHEWAGRNIEFKVTHPFVVEHHSRLAFLRSYHVEWWSSRASSVHIHWTVDWAQLAHEVNMGYIDQVEEWWETWSTGWEHKKKQLFLYGGPNKGKSTMLEKLFAGKRVFCPCVESAFPFNELSLSYDVCLFEEYRYHKGMRSMILRLLEGLAFVVDVKGGSPREIIWRKPCVFVSNFPPYADDEAFLTRVNVVCTDME